MRLIRERQVRAEIYKVFLLFEHEHVAEELLRLLIGEVDAELLELHRIASFHAHGDK